MNDIHAAAEELKRAEARKKDQQEYRERYDDLGHEVRAKGSGHTAVGKITRYRARHDDNTALLLQKPIDLAMAFVVSENLKPLFGDIPSLVKSIVGHFDNARTHDPQQHVELREDEDTSYVYETALVQRAVREQLDAEIAQVRAQEVRRTELYARGQYGPLGEDFRIFQLRDKFEMRVHPVTGDIAFSGARVARLAAEAPACNGPLCPVPIFRAVATDSLRGIRVNVADLNNDDTIKIAASDEANKVQAATVALRPGMHLRLNS